MRETEASGWIVQNSSRARTRALWLAAVALGIGLVMTAGAARAEDDDEDDKTFEEKIVGGIMAGIGGTNMENRGLEYRERSPLVVPPKLAALQVVEETAGADRLTGEELEAWLGALESLRLFLGTQLDVTEQTYEQELDPSDPSAPALALYGYLSWLQEQAVEALSSSLP